MTRYTRSRLHEEVAAYLAFWAIAERPELNPWGSASWSLRAAWSAPESEPEDPWIYLRRCIAALKGEENHDD